MTDNRRLKVRVFEIVLEDVSATFKFVLGFADFAEIAVVWDVLAALRTGGWWVESVDFLVGG